MTVRISDISNSKLIKLANKYDISKNGILEDNEVQSLFSTLEDRQNMHQEGICKLAGISAGLLCACAGNITVLEKYTKAAKNTAKNIENLTKKSVFLWCGVMAVAAGITYLGSVIGKSVDKRQNEQIEACRQELSLLNDGHYLY